MKKRNVFVVVFMFCSLAAAVSNNFKGTIDTDWGNAGNWSSGATPTGTDLVYLDSVTSAPNPAYAVVSSGSYTWSGGMTVGQSGTTTFVLDLNGGTINTTGGVVRLGNLSGGAGGTVNVNTGATWLSSSDYIHLGRACGGTINVNGGTLTYTGARMILGGAEGGNGTLNVTNGGTVNISSTTSFHTGYSSGTQRITVTDGGTLNATGVGLYLGYSLGENILTIDGGTANFTARVLMSVSGTAHSVFNLESGAANFTNGVTVGYGGTGGANAYISGGSMTSHGTVYIGLSTAATAIMTGGSMLVDNGGQLYIGAYGNGWFQLDGGTVDLSEGSLVISTYGGMDITQGTLVLAGNVSSLGGVSAYGGDGSLVFDYNLGEDVTYVTAIPEPATIGLLVIGLVMTRRKKN